MMENIELYIGIDSEKPRYIFYAELNFKSEAIYLKKK